MKLWIVGSGTLRPHPRRGSSAYWLEAGRGRILVDCGAGTLRTLARLGLPWEGISHLVLSHFHTDHVAEVAPLLFALKHGLDRPREAPLTMLGPKGLREHLGFLALAHGPYVQHPGFPLEVEELEAGTIWADPRGEFLLRTRSTPHTENSLAFRLETESGVWGYTGDTGPDPGLGEFLEGCQVLVAECSFPDGQRPDNHLSPATLLEVALRAEPGLLVTVHSYAPLDPGAVPDLLAAGGYSGEVRAGRDGMVVEWSGEAAWVRGEGE